MLNQLFNVFLKQKQSNQPLHSIDPVVIRSFQDESKMDDQNDGLLTEELRDLFSDKMKESTLSLVAQFHKTSDSQSLKGSGEVFAERMKHMQGLLCLAGYAECSRLADLSARFILSYFCRDKGFQKKLDKQVTALEETIALIFEVVDGCLRSNSSESKVLSEIGTFRAENLKTILSEMSPSLK